MRPPFRQVLTNSDGNALIETAISLPLLIVILTGIIDLGYLFSVSNSMQTVASETARLIAIRRITTSEAPAYAQSRLMRVNGTYTVATSQSGSDVTVAIALPQRNAALIDVLGMFATGNLNASTTMRVIS